MTSRPRPAGASAQGWVLGLDLGGTACRAVALGLDGVLLGRNVAPTPAREERASAAQFLIDLGRALGPLPSLVAVGIGASGPIDEAGIIRNVDTLPAFSGTPVVDELSQLLGVPAVIDNDAVTAAVAEYRVGTAAATSAFLHVTLGTGVGVCSMVDGRPFRGGDGVHPEAGHLTVAGPTAPCYCGREACFEQGGSRTALQRAAAATLGREAHDPTAIAAAQDAAAAGDDAARAVFDEYGRQLADGLNTLLGIFRPSLLVLGGSGALAYPAFANSLTESLNARGATVATPRIAVTALDDFGGAVGGALLALQAAPARD